MKGQLGEEGADRAAASSESTSVSPRPFVSWSFVIGSEATIRLPQCAVCHTIVIVAKAITSVGNFIGLGLFISTLTEQAAVFLRSQIPGVVSFIHGILGAIHENVLDTCGAWVVDEDVAA